MAKCWGCEYLLSELPTDPCNAVFTWDDRGYVTDIRARRISRDQYTDTFADVHKVDTLEAFAAKMTTPEMKYRAVIVFLLKDAVAFVRANKHCGTRIKGRKDRNDPKDIQPAYVFAIKDLRFVDATPKTIARLWGEKP